MKSGDIVKLNGVLGTVIVSSYECKGSFLFLPVGYGRYSEGELEIITEETIEECTHEDKIKWIEQDYTWGEVLKTECIGVYQIVVSERSNGEVLYSPYINYKTISCSYESMDKALIGVMAYRYDGANSQAGKFYCRMLGLNKSE